MKIAVTGATGFVGRALCRHLTDRGHQVVALTRRPAVLAANEVRVVSDFTDAVALKAALDGCDTVIHLAGRAHVLNDTAASPLAEFRAVNVGITEQLASAAAANGIVRFIFVSSIGVNGNHTNGRPFSESDAPAPHDLYAVSKWEAEQRVAAIAGDAGMDFVIARPVLMFGPDAPGNFALLLKLAAKRLPLPFGLLCKQRNLLSVWNFADFLRVCVEHPEKLDETFLVADVQTVTLPDIFRYLGQGMGKPQRLLPIPRFLLATLFALLGKSKALRKVDSELMVSSDKAIKLLNWTQPYSTSVALRRAGQEYS